MANTTFTRTFGVDAFALAVGLAVTAILERHNYTRLRGENQALRRQAVLRDELQRENVRLTSSQHIPGPPLPAEQQRELLRLRGTVARLRTELTDAANPPSASGAPANQDYDAINPETERTYGPVVRGKGRFGFDLGQAVFQFADQHQGQFPASLAEAASLLRAEAKAQTNLTPDLFELTCQGRLEDLTNPPPEATIIIRERGAWQTPSGRWVRTYVMGSGATFIHAEISEDALAKWERPRMPQASRP